MTIDPKLAELEARLEELQALREPLDQQIAETCRAINAIESGNKSRAMQLGLAANYPIVIDFNCTVGPNVLPEDLSSIFGSEKVHHFDTAGIFDILVAAGCFESKAQARKNWRGVQVLPTGYTELGPIGKRKIWIYIWNPSE